MSPAVQYDTYRDLLWATFSFLMRDDQVAAPDRHAGCAAVQRHSPGRIRRSSLTAPA